MCAGSCTHCIFPIGWVGDSMSGAFHPRAPVFASVTGCHILYTTVIFYRTAYISSLSPPFPCLLYHMIVITHRTSSLGSGKTHRHTRYLFLIFNTIMMSLPIKHHFREWVFSIPPYLAIFFVPSMLPCSVVIAHRASSLGVG